MSDWRKLSEGSGTAFGSVLGGNIYFVVSKSNDTPIVTIDFKTDCCKAPTESTKKATKCGWCEVPATFGGVSMHEFPARMTAKWDGDAQFDLSELGQQYLSNRDGGTPNDYAYDAIVLENEFRGAINDKVAEFVEFMEEPQ